MRIFAADDEMLALRALTTAIEEACVDAEVFGFQTPGELFSFAKENPACDIAFLDVQMRTMTGVELALKLKTLIPKVNIIFVTGYDCYKGEAMDMHASGYILKPVTAEKIREELKYLRFPCAPKPGCLLKVECFGNFDVKTPDGKLLTFTRSKSKEIFAYLVYKHGTAHTIKQLAAVVFEDGGYDRKKQNYMQKIISDLIKTLKQVGAEDVIVKKYNSVSLNTSLLDCDFYRFEQMDAATINSYTGEFMAQYSWAEFAIGYLDEIHHKKLNENNE